MAFQTGEVIPQDKATAEIGAYLLALNMKVQQAQALLLFQMQLENILLQVPDIILYVYQGIILQLRQMAAQQQAPHH